MTEEPGVLLRDVFRRSGVRELIEANSSGEFLSQINDYRKAMAPPLFAWRTTVWNR